MNTTVITCRCAVCNGKAARVNGDGTRDGKPYTPTMIHNLVALAHGPLSRARSVREFGPWAEDSGSVALLLLLTVPTLLVVAFVAQLLGAMVGAMGR